MSYFVSSFSNSNPLQSEDMLPTNLFSKRILGEYSDVGDPALADASSLAREFSLNSDPSALFVNLR